MQTRRAPGSGCCSLPPMVLQRSRVFANAERQPPCSGLSPCDVLQRSRVFANAESEWWYTHEATPDLASTEPRFCKRGELSNPMGNRNDIISFNGAAFLQTRRACSCHRVRQPLSSFNGAAFLQTRRAGKRPVRNIPLMNCFNGAAFLQTRRVLQCPAASSSDGQLQRSRVFANAESDCAGGGDFDLNQASTEPRFCKRGEGPGASRSESSAGRLQRSRVFANAESPQRGRRYGAQWIASTEPRFCKRGESRLPGLAESSFQASFCEGWGAERAGNIGRGEQGRPND